jgi:UDP-glucose-4-epimerase GalE
LSDTILVTGGAGYIGSHACKALAGAGYLPVSYDNLSRGHRELVRWGPLEEGDLADGRRLAEVLRVHRPVAVLHFAALIAVGESVREPLLYYRNNVGGALSLLSAMEETGVRTIVFSSTAAVYGDPERVPLTEEAPRRPVNPYGRGKRLIEELLEDQAAARGLRYASLRYFNAAGADPEGETGEWHEPETHLIPLVLRAAQGRGAPLTLFGDDYDTPDGTCIRDYIHVSDLAQAHLLAVQALLAGRPSGAFNLGSGEGYSVRQVIEACRRVTGEAIPVAIGPRREGDPPRLVADPSRARQQLGWRPALSGLDTIVRTAWAWHRRP